MRGALLPFGAQLFHHALNQRFRVADFAGDDLNVHHRFFGIAGGVAIHSVLSDQDERVGQQVECDGQASAMRAHHRFEMFQFFLVFFED